MVTLYGRGQKVGTWAADEKLLSELTARNAPVEFRNDNGEVVGTFVPSQPPTPPEPLIPWEPNVTREEIERRKAEPGFTFEEVKKRLGWE